MNNRLHNITNPYQGSYKKVLCVCSAGLLRSPTAAEVLSQDPFNFNTRACGVHDYALVPFDFVLYEWADEIVCMEPQHAHIIKAMLELEAQNGSVWSKKPIVTLGVSDCYEFRDPELVKEIFDKYIEQIQSATNAPWTAAGEVLKGGAR